MRQADERAKQDIERALRPLERLRAFTVPERKDPKTGEVLEPERVVDPLRVLFDRGRFGASPHTDGELVGRAKGAVPDPTFIAAVLGLDGREISDPVAAALNGLAGMLHDMARIGHKADRLIEYLSAHPRFSAQLRAGQGECTCCGDYEPGTHSRRLKAGYCVACYSDWVRSGRPAYHDPAPEGSDAPDARKAWEKARLAKVEAQRQGAA